jgi:hypothetical protein
MTVGAGVVVLSGSVAPSGVGLFILAVGFLPLYLNAYGGVG